MDPLYEALSYFKRRQYEKCAKICTEILEKQPLDQAVWCLKMRALTQRVYIDDIESEEIGVGDVLDENAVATAPRPGTSMKTPAMATSTLMRFVVDYSFLKRNHNNLFITLVRQ